jgi:serine/threonine protein kinase
MHYGGITLYDTGKGTMRLMPGDQFRSRWGGKSIIVERWLGEGANGSVYLARFPDGPSHCALKIGNDAYSLQSEINVLQSVGGGAPVLLLSDDGEFKGRSFPFYLMSFIPGVTLGKLASHAAGTSKTLPYAAYGERLLLQLKELHAGGWAFGDLKPDNVMVSREGEVRLVDYGGATPFGQSMKQFTELYDRGFWRAGGRKADAAYDLFAFAVLMLDAAGCGRRLRAAANASGRRDRSTLITFVEESAALTSIAPVLKRMLRSELVAAEDALHAWREAMASPAPPSAAGERWPAIWFASAVLSFAAVIWWMNGM